MPIVQNLIVEEFGAFISKRSECLIVTKGDEQWVQAPLLHLETVLIANRGVSISADAVKECAERGIARAIPRAPCFSQMRAEVGQKPICERARR